MKKTEKSTSGRNNGKPPICRIASLNKFQGVLLGRDMGSVFKEGHVYSAVEVLGEIVLTDLGKHAIPEWLGSNGTINHYATSGVVMLTKEEYNQEKKNEKL